MGDYQLQANVIVGDSNTFGTVTYYMCVVSKLQAMINAVCRNEVLQVRILKRTPTCGKAV